MLRITKLIQPTGRRVLRLEGRLVGPWVAELRGVTAGADGETTTVDLADLAFADADGVAALRGLRGAGVQLAGASGFMAALIGVDDGEDRSIG